MVETKFEFKDSRVTVECTKYDVPELEPDVSINYIEHSTDHYHPDNETSVFMTKTEAIKLVDFLQESFDI